LAEKGQVSIEFFIYVTLFMFVVIGAFILINYLQSMEIPAQHSKIVKLTGDEFANAITLAVKGGSGFTYNYTFPKTILGVPYAIYFQPAGSNTMIMEWPGPYGNFSYSYTLPAYDYAYGGDSGCILDRELTSNDCSNRITLSNDGSTLTISQER